MNDAELVAAFEGASRPLSRFYAKWGIGEHDRQDLLQETFVRVLTYRAKFQGENPAGWIFKIGIRVALGLFRTRRRKPEEWLVENHFPQRENDPLLRLEIQEALGELQSSQRLLLEMFWDGATQKELARKIGVSIPTLRLRLQEAAAAFFRIWGADE